MAGKLLTQEEELLGELVSSGCSVLVLAPGGVAKAAAVRAVAQSIPEGEPVSFAGSSEMVADLAARRPARAMVTAPDAEALWFSMSALRAARGGWLATVAGGDHLVAAADVLAAGLRTSRSLALSYLAKTFDAAAQFSDAGRLEALFCSVGGSRDERFTLLTGPDARARLFRTCEARWGCRAAEKLRAYMLREARAAAARKSA